MSHATASDSNTTTTPSSTHHARVLILDDDPWARRMLRSGLEARFPNVEIEEREDPDYSGDHEVFFIDNDFGGDRVATELARNIRTAHPESLIIAFSGTLDHEVLKDLINAGCNGACDKSQPADLVRALSITNAYLENAASQAKQNRRGGLIAAMDSIRHLLHEWNTRLDDQAAKLDENP
ncbi:MAG: response regulator [Acidobacteriota bacterium]